MDNVNLIGPTMTSRFLRLLISALVAVALVAPSAPYAVVRGAAPPRQPSNHLPAKQPRTPGVVKMRVAWAASARSSSRSDPEPGPGPAKRPPSPSPRPFTPDRSPARAARH